MPTEVPRDVLPPAERAFEGKVGTYYSDCHDAPLIKSGWLLGAGHLLQPGDSLGHRRVRREQLPHHVARPERVGDHQM